jgi:hypothetical protein
MTLSASVPDRIRAAETRRAEAVSCRERQTAEQRSVRTAAWRVEGAARVCRAPMGQMAEESKSKHWRRGEAAVCEGVEGSGRVVVQCSAVRSS